MTDTTRIYVNTTDGYWYYYDGDSWEQGGIYQSQQSTDDVLQINGILEDVYNLRDISGTDIEFKKGYYNASTNVFTNSNTRITTEGYLPQGITAINIDTNYSIFLLVYDEDDVFKGIYRIGTHTVEPSTTFTWATGKLTIPYDLIDATDKLRIVLKENNNAQIDASYSSKVSFTYKLKGKIEDGGEYLDKHKLVNYTGGTLVSYDASFTHSNPINIYKVGDQYTTDLNIDSLKHTQNKVVYISPNGDDTNGEGTKENPYLTFEKALTVTGVDTIKLLPGTYYLGYNFSDNITINADINIICDREAVLFFGDRTTKLLNPTGKFRIRGNVYVENITFNGGIGLIVEVSNVYPTFKNCKFINSSQNGIHFRGIGCYMIDCEAYDNALDGFNYHKYNSTEPTGVVEINCKAHDNGNTTNNSSNGSTIHDHGRIIRLKSKYEHNHGGNLADSTAMSYNFDIKSYSSSNHMTGNKPYSSSYMSLSYSKIWLYNCLGDASEYLLSATSGSYIYTDTDYDSDYIYADENSTISVI